MTIVESRPVPSELLRSVAVTHFRKNPFRLLRLPVHVKAQEAVWAAGKLATMRRAGLAPPERDLLPWLPDADEVDAHEALQRLEEPLRRLVDQLFWFDLEGDHDGAALMRALIAGDGGELAAYLAKNTKAENKSKKKQSLSTARRLNTANLRLILGFSALHGTGPVLPAKEKSGPARAPLFAAPLPAKRGKKKGSAPPDMVVDVHRQVDPSADDPYERAWADLLVAGYREWHELLGEQAFAKYVKAQIARMGDDLLSEDDAETIRRAVATQLADVIVAELKRALSTGRGDRTERLAKIVAVGATEGEEWRHALRSLRPLFTAQLREADILLQDDAGEPFQNLDLYFNRVRGTLARWKAIDSGGLLDLTKLADRAIGEAFDRVEAIVGPEAEPEQVHQVLSSALEGATAESLRERIATLRERYDNFRRYSLCAYCQRAPQTGSTGVIVTGKKEVRREWIGNGEAIHYSVRAAMIPRCSSCTQLQSYIDGSTTTVRVAAFIAPFPFFLFQANIVAAAILGFVIALIAGFIGKAVIEGIVGRRTHFSNVIALQTPQWKALRDEGYEFNSLDVSERAMAGWEKASA